ncbi:MAG: hypothetical protein RL260_2711 [Pseudomonadota bacterium]|jgi:hypothetical protein
MAGIGNTINGGYHAGVTFPPDTTLFQGCVFEAPCVIPEGAILIDCSSVCLRRCGFASKQCCPVFTTVGKGAIVKGGTFEYIQFESTDRLSGTSQGPEGNVTQPDCVGCGPFGQVSTAVSASSATVVSNGETLDRAAWCAKRFECGGGGVSIVGGGGNCTVTINGVTTITG